jgi:hypothetical protein
MMDERQTSTFIERFLRTNDKQPANTLFWRGLASMKYETINGHKLTKRF